MMKLQKYLLVLSLSLSFTNFYGMKRERVEVPAVPLAQVGFVPASVKASFVPQNDVKSELFSFLDNAKRQVLVAMYWITDDSIIDKLISLKRRGIDVQIIFDESMQRYMDIVNFVIRLQQAGIVPLIFPSGDIEGNLMHDKFLVVDDSAVFTGSANFTKRAFTSTVDFFNHENIIILNSRDVAQKYVAAFHAIEQDIFGLYVAIVAVFEQRDFQQWANIVFPRYQDQLKQVAQTHLQSFKHDGQARLQRYFNLQPARQPTQKRQKAGGQVEPPTQKQAGVLTSRGYSPDILSKQEASDLIGKIFKAPATAPTPKQVDILKKRDISIEGVSKEDASVLIGDIRRQEGW